MLTSFLFPHQTMMISLVSSTISLIYLNPFYTYLTDYYLYLIIPWIKMPYDLSLPTRLKNIKYLACLSKLQQSNSWPILPPNTHWHGCLFQPSWFLDMHIMFILTFVTLFSQGVTKSLSTWARARPLLQGWVLLPGIKANPETGVRRSLRDEAHF